MAHEVFHYKSWADIEDTAHRQGITLPYSENLSILRAPLQIGAYTMHNRIALQPMEGTDGTETGSPGALTVRRYHRFAEGGAGLIWFEAVATAPEVRASAHQLMLTRDNLDQFKRLVEQIKETGMKKNGYAPVVVMQATNSGRYSKPDGTPHPLIAYNNPLLENEPLPESPENRRHTGDTGTVAKKGRLPNNGRSRDRVPEDCFRGLYFVYPDVQTFFLPMLPGS